MISQAIIINYQQTIINPRYHRGYTHIRQPHIPTINKPSSTLGITVVIPIFVNLLFPTINKPSSSLGITVVTISYRNQA